jgi:hypothetical protein
VAVGETVSEMVEKDVGVKVLCGGKKIRAPVMLIVDDKQLAASKS